MIEVWRKPASAQEPHRQRYERVWFEWRKVRDNAGQLFWAATLSEEHRSVADSFVANPFGGAKDGVDAYIVEVDAPTVAATPSHSGVDLSLLRRVYDAVPEKDRHAYLRGERPHLPLPGWALKMPAKVREYLKDSEWPEHWDLKDGEPIVPDGKVEPLEEPAAISGEGHKPAAATLDTYGTAEEIEKALGIIKDLITDTKGGDPSPQKVSANVTRKAGLPSTTDHYDALLARAKEMIDG